MYEINMAIKYFTDAANQNNAESEYYLGIIFYEGIYIKKDYKQSFLYFSQAANQNYPPALQFDPDYQFKYCENRKCGENDKYLCMLIRNDEAEKFISHINLAKIRFSSQIEPSIYETNSILIENKPTLIEYAAFYGSIQIVKYLIFNGVEIDEKLWLYAIHSNNADLFHYIESIQTFKDDETIEQIYLESIKCHHNRISEYIEFNLLNKPNGKTEYNEKINYTILKYCNYLYFPKDIGQNFVFYYLCKYKYTSIYKLFLKTIKIKEEISNFSNKKLLRKAAEENKIHIAYYLLRKQKKIKGKTFEGCHYLKKFSIPTNIKTICEYSFKDCTSLTEIYIPTSVKTIEQCAFYGCSSLKKVYIPNSVKSIERCAFYGCSSLKKIHIPKSIKIICEYSFNECSSLKKIYIPTSVKTIEQCAFYGCSSLKEVYIPKSVTSIGPHSFRECSSLQKVIIPSTVTLIDSFTFDRCYKLTSITIPESVTIIGKCAFYECTSLSNISLPSSLTTIESHAFYGCSSFIQMNIPKSITQICGKSMKLCTSLSTITIPSSIRIIESYSFSECSSLTRISFESSSLLSEINQFAFYKCISLS